MLCAKFLFFFFFFFFFFIQFYVPFKLFHSYRDESIGRWGENRSTRGKYHLTHPQAEHGLSHIIVPSFKNIFVLEQKMHLHFFTVYGHGGHLDQVTLLNYI